MSEMGRVVSGGEMFGLSENKQLELLLGNTQFVEVDKSQRLHYEHMIRRWFKMKKGGKCKHASPTSGCEDRLGLPIVGVGSLVWHHTDARQPLYYVNSYRHANDPAKRSSNIASYTEEAAKCWLLCPKHHDALHSDRQARRVLEQVGEH